MPSSAPKPEVAQAPFPAAIVDQAHLRDLYREPGRLITGKKTHRLSGPTQAFIAASPLLFLATADAAGRSSVSPKGGEPGFVAVLDEHRLAMPEARGNNLIDGLRNIVDNPRASMLFVIPGRDETLRVEGRAWLTTDEALVERFVVDGAARPKLVIGMEVDSVFVHCSQAFRRGSVWAAETWDPDRAPATMDVYRDHLADNLSPEELPGA
jgi:hypothetical protein